MSNRSIVVVAAAVALGISAWMAGNHIWELLLHMHGR